MMKESKYLQHVQMFNEKNYVDIHRYCYLIKNFLIQT